MPKVPATDPGKGTKSKYTQRMKEASQFSNNGRTFINRKMAQDEIDSFDADRPKVLYHANQRMPIYKKSAKDDRLTTAARLGPITPWGVQIADPDIIDVIQEKQIEELEAAELALAAFIADPNDPSSVERMYSMFPALKNRPEQQHTDDLLIQETIRTMLRDGKIESEDDNRIMMHLLRPDSEVPIFPLWDPTGIYITKMVQKAYKGKEGDFFRAFTGDNENKQLELGIWGRYFIDQDPRKVDARKPEYWELQKMIKKLLLRRCYQGFSALTDEQLDNVMNSLLSHVSPATGMAMGQKTQDHIVGQIKEAVDKPFWRPL